MKIIKRISAFILSAVVLVTLSSCGNKYATIFTLNGIKVDSRDVDAFAFIYVMEHNLVETDRLDDIFENGETYAEHYKNELEEEIILSVLLSKEADENKVVLSKDDKIEAQDKADKLISKFGEERLEGLDIGRDDVERLYEMKLRGNTYASSIGDEYSDVLDNQSEAPTSSSATEDSDRYVRVFQVTFPIAVLDASGMIKTDQNGELITIPEGEKEQMKAAAEEFCQKAKSGESMETLLKNESKDVNGVERTLKYSDLSKEYKAAVDKISKGDVSDVITGDYGYYVIQMLEDNDVEHAESIEGYEKQLKAIEARDELYEKLMNTYVGNDKDYRNDELWNGISLRKYMQ